MRIVSQKISPELSQVFRARTLVNGKHRREKMRKSSQGRGQTHPECGHSVVFTQQQEGSSTDEKPWYGCVGAQGERQMAYIYGT